MVNGIQLSTTRLAAFVYNLQQLCVAILYFEWSQPHLLPTQASVPASAVCWLYFLYTFNCSLFGGTASHQTHAGRNWHEEMDAYGC